jgi:hypothetical protein
MSKFAFQATMKNGMMSVLVAVMLGSGSVGVAENRGPEKIDINAGAKGVVAFTHHKHQDVVNADCKVCHELFPKAKNSIDKLIADGKLRKKKVMNQCVKCHRETKREGEKSGPLKCRDCHPK